MILLSLLTNKDSYNTQIIQSVNDTIFRKRFRVPGFGTGSGTLEPVLWDRFLRQITSLSEASSANRGPLMSEGLRKRQAYSYAGSRKLEGPMHYYGDVSLVLKCFFFLARLWHVPVICLLYGSCRSSLRKCP